MTHSLSIAAFQLCAHDRTDFATIWQAALERIATAARGADLLVLPESTIPAYVLGEEPIEDAAIARAVTSLQQLAASSQTAIVVGVAARAPSGAQRNRALVIDCDGSIAGHSDKIFLWDFDRQWFESGERIAPVETSLGRLGALVCADGRMPEIARALVDQGAELLVMPTAWVTSGRDPANLENVQADLLGRVRAFENGVPFIAANKCGTECGMVAYCGKSQIVDAYGDVIAIASQAEETTLRARIHLRRAQPRRTHARPKLRDTDSGVLTAHANVRVAFSLDPPSSRDGHLAWLDAVELDVLACAVQVNDDALFDPAALVDARLAGCRLAIWHVSNISPWTERIACARAVELRIYVVVLDRGCGRAYAIDPDGRVVAGTFGAYRLASFWFDIGKTQQTTLVPGTDVLVGLARVQELINAEDT